MPWWILVSDTASDREVAEPTNIAAQDHRLANVRGGSSSRDQGYWAQSWLRLKHDRLGVFSGAALVGICLVALSADLWAAQVTHHTAEQQDLSNVFGRFSGSHWLGTDELGRDTLTRL